MAFFAWCVLGLATLIFGIYNTARPVVDWVDGTAATADLTHMTCHSHNNDRTLHAALAHGCASIGVDVRLSNSREVVVGAVQDQTLSSLYLEPLLELLEQRIVFVSENARKLRSKPESFPDPRELDSLVLVLNFLGNGTALWPLIHSALQPLRLKGHLTRFDGFDVKYGPVTIVASGNAPFRKIIAEGSSRDIFFDAPLCLMSPSTAGVMDEVPSEGGLLGHESSVLDLEPMLGPDTESVREEQYPRNAAVYSIVNSYYASASFKTTIGQMEEGPLTASQLQVLREQISGAHARGLKVRYWDLSGDTKKEREDLRLLLRSAGADVLGL